jgi:uncharacterized membrane protein
MRTRLLNIWEFFRNSFWFVPAVMMFVAILMAAALIFFDASFKESAYNDQSWIQMNPPAARSILSSIVGAMVTSTGVVFSITVVALTLASSQFGSRLIRTYRNRRSTHFTLGIFVSTSLFCILTLASIREAEAYRFVPTTAVAVGIMLTIVCLATLIYYIHDISNAIQAPNVILSSATDLDVAIERMFPDRLGEPAKSPNSSEQDTASEQPSDHVVFRDPDLSVCCCKEGYLQAIENETIVRLARESKAIVKIVQQPGDFVSERSTLAEVFELPGGESDEQLEQLNRNIQNAFIVGVTRTPTQDVRYAFNELTEIAIRALSPGINDPFTAITCVDRIEAALLRLKSRKRPDPFRTDETGRLCVVALPVTFEDCRDGSLGMIAAYVEDSPRVKRRLEKAMQRTADEPGPE